LSTREPAIADYGIIGDMRTAALVSHRGGIDWCCLPRFDSGSLFAALLDPRRGGSWQVQPQGAFASRQRYLTGTNVLETRFQTETGEAALTDFMPLGADGCPGATHPEVHRRLHGVHGRVVMHLRFKPRFDYASRATRLSVFRTGILASDRCDQAVTLSTDQPLQWRVTRGAAEAEVPLSAGELRWLVLRYDDDDLQSVDLAGSAEKLEATIGYWLRWSSRLRYSGPHRDAVQRSALLLKLLTDSGSGGIIAAPTASLPEVIGGQRNWDYRFVWLRDAVFTLSALERVGYDAEAGHFMGFLRRVARHQGRIPLQVLYGVDGRRDITERELPHLSGYRGSRPVRVGNGAVHQLQMDVYGDLLAAADHWRRHHALSEGTWRTLHPLIDWVSRNWHRPDSSIWEVRGETRHYCYSKVMSWVALDRGVRIAADLQLEGDVGRWAAERDRLRAEILDRGWSPAKSAFIQDYDHPDTLDAALLSVGISGFLPWEDPRVESTVRAIQRELTSPAGDLVYRYRTADGFRGDEGAFSICSFWLAEALFRIGARSEGERLFDRMLARANPLGLYSEEIDPRTGEFLGNFPQGLTHLALIRCAVALTGP
jgi:GH15 family glucan-1,4-alpha-glucosidase